MRTSARKGVAAGWLAAMLWCGAFFAPPAMATPVDATIEATLDVAEAGWSDTVSGKVDSVPLDEQIFTEISPIVTTDNAVRLPQDQQE